MNILKNCSGAHKVSGRHRIALLPFSLSVILITLLPSCGPSSKEKIMMEEHSAHLHQSRTLADSVASIDPAIATETINGITHNFIRTADLKFRVKDALNATQKIEKITSLAGGYATNSDLSSSETYSTSIKVRKDSALEQHYFTTFSHLTLRVPNENLDTVISQITALAITVNHRNIKANDVKLKLYSNKLAQNRYAAYKNRVQKKIDTKDAKLAHVTDAEDKALEKQTLADSKNIENYELADQVNYSTIVLELYQPQTVASELVALPFTVEPYEPGFTEKFKNAFVNGFNVLKSVLLFFVNFWGLFLLLAVIFFAVKKLIYFYSTKETNIKRAD